MEVDGRQPRARRALPEVAEQRCEKLLGDGDSGSDEPLTAAQALDLRGPLTRRQVGEAVLPLDGDALALGTSLRGRHAGDTRQSARSLATLRQRPPSRNLAPAGCARHALVVEGKAPRSARASAGTGAAADQARRELNQATGNASGQIPRRRRYLRTPARTAAPSPRRTEACLAHPAGARFLLGGRWRRVASERADWRVSPAWRPLSDVPSARASPSRGSTASPT